jgi:hypothetical protein
MLEKKILDYAIRLKKKHDYPAFVSGAEYLSIEALGKSGAINKGDHASNFARLIESKNFGRIGDKYQNSSIGFCAEQVAANKIILRHPASVSKIHVGSAVRPKTLQYGKKCVICKTLF